VVSGIAPAGPVPGTTWVWEFSAPQLGLLPEGTGNIPTFSASNPSLVPDNGVVTVTPVFASGGAACAGIPTDFTLTVLPAPTVGPTSSEVCSGELVELSLNSDLASTYAWFAIPQPNVLGETSFPIQSGSQISQILTTDALFAQTVSYQVVATDILNGCSSPPTAIPVTVHPLPLLGFTVLNSSTCELNPIYFSNNSPGTLTYLWDFGDGTTSVADDPVHAYPGPGEYVVELTGSNPLTGCTNSIDEELEIGVIPDATFLVSDSSGCGLTEVEFLAVTQDSALVYLWNFGDGSQSTQIGSAGNQFAPTGCFDVTLTLTDGAGCVGTFGIEEAVCAFPIPNAEFNASPYTTTTLDPEIEFTNGSTFATSYFWEFGDGNTSYDPDPVHVYQGFGTFQVKLTASNGTECIDEARASIVVNPDLGIYVPNAFTPGTLGPQSNDGINDAFKPVISDPSLLVFYHFQIFDRWGNVIWESYDPDAWWTGGVDPGNDYYVNNDLYEWRLHVKTTWSDNDIISFGHVTVVK
jgi:PKD repeat protein